VVVGVVAMDACAPEADSSRGGAIARAWRRWLSVGLAVVLSVDFHGVFGGPRLLVGGG
jgi:hypothetical protein